MKKNIISILIMLFILGFPSCDDGLDTLPTGVVSDQIFWQKESDAEQAVNAAYRELDGSFIIWLDAISDIAMTSPAGPGTFYDLAVGLIDPTNMQVRSYWRRYWTGVRKANDPIKNIVRIETGDPVLLARLTAEARFLRAYYYTQLTSLWGDVPLILEPLQIDQHIARTGINTVVDFIIAELDDIINSQALPLSYSGNNIGRATHGAALALKARVALRNGRFAIARDAAKAVMDLGVYELHPNYVELFWYAGQNSKEVIFDRQYALGGQTHNLFSFSAGSIGGSSSINPLHHFKLQHERIAPENPDDPYMGLDPRWGHNVLYTGAASVDGSIYNSWPESTTADRIGRDQWATQYGFNMKKWIDWSRDVASPSNSTLNFILIRYADVLLMYAEAKIELNELDQSVYDAINEVRQRPTVEMPLITSGKTQSELREIVRRERTVELPFEGLRLFDMNRWKLGEKKAGLATGMLFKEEGSEEWQLFDRGLDRRFRADRDYLWPIPQEEMEVNSNITQNPNY